MSTSAHIVLRLDDSDVGSIRKQDLSKVNVNKRFVKELPREVKLEKRYMSIICQWDGHPHSTGAVLFSEYKDKDSILNLLLGGNASSIIDEVVQYSTIYDEEKEPWDYNKPRFYDAIPEVTEDYLYLFQDNVWQVAKSHENELKMLSDVLSKNK